MSDNVQKAFDKINIRRLNLIAKKIEQGLTPEEQVELDRLTKRVDTIICALFPISALSPKTPRKPSGQQLSLLDHIERGRD